MRSTTRARLALCTSASRSVPIGTAIARKTSGTETPLALLREIRSLLDRVTQGGASIRVDAS